MNLYITKGGKEVQGFQSIAVDGGKCNFENIPNNSCSQIIIQDAVEYIDNLEEFYKQIHSLIRKNGTLRVYGLDLRSVCLAYVTGDIDTKNFASLTEGMKTIVSLQDWTVILQGSGLQIERCNVDNNMYELIASRV